MTASQAWKSQSKDQTLKRAKNYSRTKPSCKKFYNKKDTHISNNCFSQRTANKQKNNNRRQKQFTNCQQNHDFFNFIVFLTIKTELKLS